MALASSKLKEEILKLVDPDHASFVGFPADVATAAANWATAYDNYALDAVDFSGDAVSVVNKAGFESTLASQLAPSTSAATAAAAFGAAWLAYWTGAVFSVGTPPISGACPNVGGNTIFGIEATSVVTAVINAGLITLLTTEFGVLTEDADAKATAIANAFHTATTTGITVLISGTDTTPPPTGPLPITNTCTVF